MVDDASPGVASTVLSQLPPSVRVIRLPENSGPGRARQVGTEAASSTLVTYLDSDDMWSRDFLACCLDRLRHDTGCPAVYTPIAKRHPDGTLMVYDDKPALLHAREAIVRFHAYPALAMVFRRDTLLSIGGWSFDRGIVEDWDLMVRFLDRFGPIPLVRGPLPEYRVNHEPGRRNSTAWPKIMRWYNTAMRNRELLERYYGSKAHRRRFAQAIRDRADRTGGPRALAMKVAGLPFGAPLDEAFARERKA